MSNKSTTFPVQGTNLELTPVERVRWMLSYKHCERYSNNVAPCGGAIALVAIEEELYVKLSVTCTQCLAYEMLRIGHEEAEAHDLALALVAAEARTAADGSICAPNPTREDAQLALTLKVHRMLEALR